MASDNGGGSPLGSDYMDADAFAQYLGGDLTDADSEINHNDMELVQSPAEPSIDENATPTIKDAGTTPHETQRPRPLPFVIPEGAEVIDLDMLDDDSFTFVYDVEEGVMVKEEPAETLMAEIEKHDEDIKEEYDSDCSSLQFDWSMEMPKEHIMISDDEDDIPVRVAVHQRKGSLEVVEPVAPLKKLLLTKKKPRAQLTDAEKAKMAEIQAKLAAIATGRPITGGAGVVFKGNGAKAQPTGPTRPTGPNGTTAPAEPDDPFAWMHEEVDIEEVDDASDKFEALKRKHKSRLKSGKASFEDEINFQKAEKAEHARLKRRQDDLLRAQEFQPDPGAADGEEEEEDGLFVPLELLKQKQRKRPHNVTVDDPSDNDVDVGEPTAKRAKHGLSDKKQQALHTKILEVGMLAALETAMAKGNTEEKKGRGKGKISSDKSASDKKKPSNRKPKTGPKANETSADKPKGKKPPGKPKAKNPKGKGKAKQPNLLNVDSLLYSNVYADANAGLDSGPIPVMTEIKKKDALKQLIASVPLEDQRMANREREHIRQATTKLAKNNVHADGKGGWKLKGMTTSLKHHQVQGAAWMRERETGTDEPLGGLVGDEMGFGKTIQMLACMVANPPPPGSPHRATLIVATSALCGQWHDEIMKHVDNKALGSVIRYDAASRIMGDGAVELLQSAGVILTTYSEVLRSYPKYNPPMELMTYEAKHDWWKGHYDKKRGLLHRLSFFRVVLDEAQAIKNRISQTSIACRGLVTKCRWAMSGTPIQNSVDELYPYFKFLHVKHTGSFEVFKQNFCDKESGLCNERLHSFLRQFMIRRTHADRLFGAPLISLPKNNEKTISLEFNEVERAIYEIIRKRYIKRINEWRSNGVLEKSYSNVLTMLLRLRQLTAHIFLLQETIEDLLELEDVERLWEGTATEVETASGKEDVNAKNMLIQMRKMIADKGRSKDVQEAATAASSNAAEDDAAFEKSDPLVFKFRKFLRDLSEGSKWEDLAKRSLCHKCRDAPQDPHVTECLHIYCKECLKTMAYEAAQNGEDHASCLDCGRVYSETRPCSGLKELGHEDSRARSESGTPASSHRPKRNPEDDVKWVSMEGSILPSTKSTAMVAQIEQWLKEDSKIKIIVFTQWHLMIKIISRICKSRGWAHCTYHGKMTQDARERTLFEFRNNEDVQIMVASLKCGGVGLNLTCASRVINIDLFWNSSVEMQAFCRVFRIGQEKETFITRFVIKNTVDEKLQRLQEDKKETIDAAIGDDGKRQAKLSLTELMRLFGPVQGEEGREFILVDDGDEYADTMPAIANEHEDNTYVPPPHL